MLFLLERDVVSGITRVERNSKINRRSVIVAIKENYSHGRFLGEGIEL